MKLIITWVQFIFYSIETFFSTARLASYYLSNVLIIFLLSESSCGRCSVWRSSSWRWWSATWFVGCLRSFLPLKSTTTSAWRAERNLNAQTGKERGLWSNNRNLSVNLSRKWETERRSWNERCLKNWPLSREIREGWLLLFLLLLQSRLRSHRSLQLHPLHRFLQLHPLPLTNPLFSQSQNDTVDLPFSLATTTSPCIWKFLVNWLRGGKLGWRMTRSNFPSSFSPNISLQLFRWVLSCCQLNYCNEIFLILFQPLMLGAEMLPTKWLK